MSPQNTYLIESLRQQRSQDIDHIDELVANNLAESHHAEVPRLGGVATTGNANEDIAEEEEINEDGEGELRQNNAIDHVMTFDSYGKLR